MLMIDETETADRAVLFQIRRTMKKNGALKEFDEALHTEFNGSGKITPGQVCRLALVVVKRHQKFHKAQWVEFCTFMGTR